MKKYLPLFALLGSALAFTASAADAPTEKPAAKKPVKKAAKKPAAKKAAEKHAPAALPVEDEDGKEPDIAGSAITEYQCELGANVAIYRNKGDDKHIALRWGKELHRMRRVDTTTGADRFENRKSGLIWIGIPAKGILLDAKKGQQLANECKSPEQMMAKPGVPTTVMPVSAGSTTSTPAASVPAGSAPAASAPAAAPAEPAKDTPKEAPKEAPKS